MPPQQQQKPIGNPLLAKGVASFPTPIVTDQVITEYVSAEIGKYQVYTYGTLWDDIDHGAYPISHPGYQLVFQAPALDANGWHYERIYVNDRVDQDSYNTSGITFQDGNTAYPQITRVYVYPRDSYNTDPVGPNGPLAPLTPDPQYSNALLVQEQMLNEATPEQIQSKYVKVARVYSVIPGPLVVSADFDENLNCMVSTSRQMVLSTNTFDPTTVPLLLAAKEDPQTAYIKMRVLSYLLALPATFEEESTGTYAFPTLVFDIPIDKYQLTTDPDRSEVYWYFDKEDAPQVPALLKTETSFSDGEPTGETIFVLPVQTLFYRGVSYQITISNVLNDAITTAVAFTADTRYGDLSEVHTFSASAITANEYISSIRGTYQIIGCDIKRYRGNLFVKRITTCFMV